MPKERINKNNVPRPQTLSPSKPVQNGDTDHHHTDGCTNETHDSPQRSKMERTKSILKQSSKEKEAGDMPSPRKENITFAPVSECQIRSDTVENVKETKKPCDTKDVDRETQCDIRKNNSAQNFVSTGTEPVDIEAKTVDKQIG